MGLCAQYTKYDRLARLPDRPTRFDSLAEVTQMQILDRYLALCPSQRKERKLRILKRLELR